MSGHSRGRLRASPSPGARTAWHTHPNGQTIYIADGVGLAQRRNVAEWGDHVTDEEYGAAPPIDR